MDKKIQLCLDCEYFREINKSVYFCEKRKEVIRTIRNECEYYPSEKYNQKEMKKTW